MSLEALPGGAARNMTKDPLEILRTMVSLLEEGGSGLEPFSSDPLRACKSAVKLGDILTPEEAESLLSSLLACRNHSMCPHGRPTLLRISMNDLSKLFGRGGA